MRNDLNRRFFLPYLVKLSNNVTNIRSEQINAGGDPNWNAAADPLWLADSTAVVWSENFAPGANPSAHKAAGSTEPGGRNSRTMIARFPSLQPSKNNAPPPTSDTVPWAIPFNVTTDTAPSRVDMPGGTYTLFGHKGSADVTITENSARTADTGVEVTYMNFQMQEQFNDEPPGMLNGTESVQSNPDGSLTRPENLALSGPEGGTKVTSEPDGFTVQAAVVFQSLFCATGTMTTTIDGQAYTQPPNNSGCV
jgi:hypothetical protein